MADSPTDEPGPRPDEPQPVFLPPGSGMVLDFLSVTHRLTSDQSGSSIYIVESAFGPGDGNRLHVHSREDEIAHVLDGALEVRLRDRTAVPTCTRRTRRPTSSASRPSGRARSTGTSDRRTPMM